MTRHGLPAPYEALEHTADAAVRVEGATSEIALARLVLAMSQLLTGGGPLHPTGERTITVDPGDHAGMAVDVLRELLYVFDCEHLIAGACEVRHFEPDRGTQVIVELGPWDPEQHGEGTALKAVTLHEARCERTEDGWSAQVIFDV
jgi:SHS2 domain-containing protein